MAWPEEYIQFEVMRQMRWSWADLEATPVYVVEQVIALLALKAETASLADLLNSES